MRLAPFGGFLGDQRNEEPAWDFRGSRLSIFRETERGDRLSLELPSIRTLLSQNNGYFQSGTICQLSGKPLLLGRTASQAIFVLNVSHSTK
ncbi:hypothetical protein CEXT_532101 [Caerostris extrusa]|uniref:Uncharacterized protein n=1 Tax=Caerostris extrusa TaxID=172846 RepID=A0AAV4PW95_CAEEX|nr:hypothetical protein CEXT_532101 [Caerostris extrusa]